MSMGYKASKKSKSKAKQRAVKAFGGKCGVCGYDRCVQALDFHHIDPSKKESSVAVLIKQSFAWSRVVEELRKCCLVCSNCHRELHAGLIHLPEDVVRFDESYSGLENLKKESNLCLVCKKECGRNAKHCRACMPRPTKIEWSKVDWKDLKNRGLSFEGIGKVLGVSGKTAKKRYLQATVAFV